MIVLSGDEATAVLDRQTAVMEEIASGTSLPDVLDSVVSALEDLMPASQCSILLLDDAGTLRHGSAPTLPEAYSEAIDGLVPGPLAGSCGTAVYFDEPVIAVDVTTDPRWEQFRELAARYRLRACWSSPIRCQEPSPCTTPHRMSPVIATKNWCAGSPTSRHSRWNTTKQRRNVRPAIEPTWLDKRRNGQTWPSHNLSRH
jgi:hypothetical protein